MRKPRTLKEIDAALRRLDRDNANIEVQAFTAIDIAKELKRKDFEGSIGALTTAMNSLAARDAERSEEVRKLQSANLSHRFEMLLVTVHGLDRQMAGYSDEVRGLRKDVADLRRAPVEWAKEWAKRIETLERAVDSIRFELRDLAQPRPVPASRWNRLVAWARARAARILGIKEGSAAR